MERELPIYKLNGINFHVEIKKAELIEVETPFLNIIKVNELVDAGTHYVLHWNELDKNQDTYQAYIRRNLGERNKTNQPAHQSAFSKFKEEQQDNIVHIPPLKNLDPLGMSTQYHVSLEALKTMTDYEIMVNQHLLKRRQLGVLPILRIGLHDFLVDIQSNAILPLVRSTAQRINLSSLERFEKKGGSGYVVPWDMKSGQIAKTEFHNLTQLPLHIKYVEIPPKDLLDPYGYYLRYGNEEELRIALRTIPLKEKTEARTLDWNETGIPALIEKNNQEKLSIWAKGQVGKRIKSRVKRSI